MLGVSHLRWEKGQKSPTQQIYISASHCWWLHGPQYPYCYPCCWQLNPNHYRSKTPSVINSCGNFQATNGSFFWYMIYNDGIMEPGSSGAGGLCTGPGWTRVRRFGRSEGVLWRGLVKRSVMSCVRFRGQPRDGLNGLDGLDLGQGMDAIQCHSFYCQGEHRQDLRILGYEFLCSLRIGRWRPPELVLFGRVIPSFNNCLLDGPMFRLQKFGGHWFWFIPSLQQNNIVMDL